jgi:hypothetical protein
MSNQYVILNTDIPTSGRSYPKGFQLKVRGLTYSQIYAMSTFLQDFDLKQLLESIDDAILFTDSSDNKLPLNSLEPCDLHHICILTTLFTDPNAKWYESHVCPSCLVESEIEMDLDSIKYENLLKNLPTPIGLISTDDYKLYPPSVEAKLLVDDYENTYELSDKTLPIQVFKSLLSYAVVLSTDHDKLLDIVDLLNHNPEIVVEVKELTKELVIEIFHTATCPKCKHSSKESLDLNKNLRRFL